MMKLIKQQLRHNLVCLKNANYHMKEKNYEEVLENLKKSQLHLKSVESLNQFVEQKIIKN